MKFTVQAPDGRKITLEGDHAPSESELNQIFGIKPEMLPMTDEQRAQATEQAQAWREQVKPRTLGDVVSDIAVTNPAARQLGFLAQGITNAGLNPVGYIARAAGMDTKPLQAQTAGERITELAGQYGYDAAGIGGALSSMARLGVGGSGLAGNVVKTLAEGGVPLAVTGSTGSAIATGLINPKNPYARMLTDTIGGGVGSVAAMRPQLSTATKAQAKSIKQLADELGQDVLNKNMRDVKRTGRSLLEVGDDQVLQAAQQARQQSPEARSILTQKAKEILEAQPQRTRGAIDEALGTQGKGASIKEVIENAQREAQPLYDEVNAMGNLEQSLNKKAQLDLINNTNPMFDDYHTGIRNVGDIKTFEEAIKDPESFVWGDFTKEQAEQALKNKRVKVYSSKPIENGNFVSTSKNQARDYAGGGTIYEKEVPIDNVAWINGDEGQFAVAPSIVKDNDVVADAIKSVKRSYSSMKNLPDTDARVLVQARKILSAQTISPDTTLAWQAREALKEFDPVINEVTGGKLARANKIYENAHKFEEAADLGRGVFGGKMTPEDFKATIDGLSKSEKRAAEIGLRDEMINRIGSAENESIAAKKFLPQNTREKIIAIAGEEGGNKIINEAEQAVKATRNIGKLLSGSQTSEKQSLRDVAKGLKGWIRNPWDNSVDTAFSRFDKARNLRMAEYLTNPDIIEAYSNVQSDALRNALMPKAAPYSQSFLRSILENQ